MIKTMKELTPQLHSLFETAKQTSQNAYAPYSGFKVGAALLTSSGKVYTGCNIENASYSATICAERTAILKAVSENEYDFVAIAIYVHAEKVFPPCGICRQVMAEFSSDLLIVYGNDECVFVSDIKTLLPEAFNL